MKKQFSFLFATAILSFFVLVSCQKNDDPDPKTKTELITSGSWRFSAATVGGVDASSGIQPCQKDNIMTFSVALTGVTDEGLTKCNSGDPQQRTFTWNFQTNETVVFVSNPLFTGGSSTFNLLTLNESQLILSQMITLGGTPQNVVVTFLH